MQEYEDNHAGFIIHKAGSRKYPPFVAPDGIHLMHQYKSQSQSENINSHAFRFKANNYEKEVKF